MRPVCLPAAAAGGPRAGRAPASGIIGGARVGWVGRRQYAWELQAPSNREGGPAARHVRLPNAAPGSDCPQPGPLRRCLACTAEVYQILDLYRRVYEELLAVPVCKVRSWGAPRGAMHAHDGRAQPRARVLPRQAGAMGSSVAAAGPQGRPWGRHHQGQHQLTWHTQDDACRGPLFDPRYAPRGPPLARRASSRARRSLLGRCTPPRWRPSSPRTGAASRPPPRTAWARTSPSEAARAGRGGGRASAAVRGGRTRSCVRCAGPWRALHAPACPTLRFAATGACAHCCEKAGRSLSAPPRRRPAPRAAQDVWHRV